MTLPTFLRDPIELYPGAGSGRGEERRRLRSHEFVDKLVAEILDL
jgi:hypothetical protein